MKPPTYLHDVLVMSLLCCVMVISACQVETSQNAKPDEEESATIGSTAENKALVSRWIEARNANDLEAAIALWTDEWQDRIRAPFNEVTESFPDVEITPHEMVAEGERVALRWTFTATHRRPYRGIPATGNAINWTGIDIYTIKDGRIARIEREADSMALLRQLGVEISSHDRIVP